VITDWREPNVVRFAPAPLYCSFEDMYNFGQILKTGIKEVSQYWKTHDKYLFVNGFFHSGNS
jgi:kynureninase